MHFFAWVDFFIKGEIMADKSDKKKEFKKVEKSFYVPEFNISVKAENATEAVKIAKKESK